MWGIACTLDRPQSLFYSILYNLTAEQDGIFYITRQRTQPLLTTRIFVQVFTTSLSPHHCNCQFTENLLLPKIFMTKIGLRKKTASFYLNFLFPWQIHNIWWIQQERKELGIAGYPDQSYWHLFKSGFSECDVLIPRFLSTLPWLLNNLELQF